MPFVMPTVAPSSFPDRIFDLRDFGAVGGKCSCDGRTNSERVVPSGDQGYLIL